MASDYDFFAVLAFHYPALDGFAQVNKVFHGLLYRLHQKIMKKPGSWDFNPGQLGLVASILPPAPTASDFVVAIFNSNQTFPE